MENGSLPAEGNNLQAESPPFKRKIWVSIILFIFGPALPLIYCGKVKSGIYLMLALSIFDALTFILLTKTFSLLLAVVIFWVIASVLLLIYMIRYTMKANRLNFPRLKYTWTIIIALFVGGFLITEAIEYLAELDDVEPYGMPSGSMENTLLVGDYFLAGKSMEINKIKPGDIVIFRHPGNREQNYIKRCIAVGGQKVKIVNKQLYVDDSSVVLPPYGQLIDTAHVYPHYNDGAWGPGNRDNMPEVTVPKGMLFVLGDNRDNSSDSRFFGFVQSSDVFGKAMYIYFSWDKERNRIRWERLGKRLDV